MSRHFATGLQYLEGNTVILTIVDRFSKAVHFVCLPKLPSAMETASILVQQVFRLYHVGLRVPIFLSGLEGFLSSPGNLDQSFLGVSHPD